MTPGARLQTVIELHERVRANAKPADQTLHDYLRTRKFIGSKDRRAITDMVFGLLRHHARLSWWVQKTGMPDTGRAFVLLWLAIGVGKTRQDIAALFDGAGYAPASLTRFENDIIDDYAGLDFMPDDMPRDVRLECPSWAFADVEKQFGAKVDDELNALMDEAPLDMRVNTLKADRDSVLKKLRAPDFDARPTPFSPLGLRLAGRPAFSAHPLYRDGVIEVQDEGSQMLALLCGVKPGEAVVDFCAGAGGKTLALAAQMQNKGRIWACDIEELRLDNCRKRLRRAGVHCVTTQLLDDERDDWVKKHKGKADCVLIDAPCSGVGTWRRNPFSRWQSIGPDLKQLVTIQADILESAARLVKSGGRLVYATCSVLWRENQGQVEKFMAAHPEFRVVPLSDMWAKTGFDTPDGLNLSSHMLQMSPGRHGTDGFFIAVLKRL